MEFQNFNLVFLSVCQDIAVLHQIMQFLTDGLITIWNQHDVT